MPGGLNVCPVSFPQHPQQSWLVDHPAPDFAVARCEKERDEPHLFLVVGARQGGSTSYTRTGVECIVSIWMFLLRDNVREEEEIHHRGQAWKACEVGLAPQRPGFRDPGK